MKKTTKDTTVKKYASRTELIEQLTYWHAKCGIAIREAECVELFKEIVARLKKTDGKKVPMAGLVQQYPLNNTELFLLLFLGTSQLLRIITPSTCKVTALLQQAQTFAPTKEVLETLFDGKSVLLARGILRLSGGVVDLKRNPLLADPPRKAIGQTRRTFTPQRVLAELDKYVIGQEEAKKQLVAGVFEHLAKCAQNPDMPFTKNNIFISGPTGCGKTYLCQCLARILKIPFIHADASQYTQTGYVGMSVGSILNPLRPLAKAKNKLPLAIVFIDEIDKLREGSDRWGISSANVQAELLRMIESRYFTTEESFSHQMTEWEISQVLFVMGGAFEKLQVRHADKSVGFTPAPAVREKRLSADDYIGYGMLPELMGRFSYFVQLHPLEKEDLRRILLNPHNGPLQQYKTLLRTTVPLQPELVEEMVNLAYERRLGARGLHQQVGKLFQQHFLERSVKVCL